MENQSVLEKVQQKAQQWLDGQYDEATKSAIKGMMEKADKTELIDSFYRDLEFGTGGLRGIMGAGSNRMNIYTVGAATQGLANYLNRTFASLKQIKVVVGHDCRNNSRLFAETVANIFSANGIKVYLFDSLRPTPEISFAIRHLDCQSGVIITASHNPKIYNGYKAYWNDGAQIIAPHDTNIIDEVNKIDSVGAIQFEGNPALIEIVGEQIDNLYLTEVKKISLDPQVIARQSDMKIVYSPIHGTGYKLVPQSLRNFGFKNIINVPEQDLISGEFPTVVSPNPEETAAMEMAIKKAIETNADIVMASDPDGDRLGVAVKNNEGVFVILNGNQTAMLLTWYMIMKWKETGKLTGNEYIIKTIVTSETIKDIAVKNNIEYFDVYTGFKWIAGKIRELEGVKKYICGGEESFGFMPGDYVRDKDAVASISIMAEIAAWAKDQGKSLYDVLQDIYTEYGFSKEKMIYIVREGKSGADEIQQLMVDYRQNPPATMGGSKVTLIKDYLSLEAKNVNSGKIEKIDLPATSNVLQFFTEDGSKVSVRPSGTEPKIKFYFEVKVPMNGKAEFAKANELADVKIDQAVKDMNL
ncbi:MAG: phospho-sugar mutase [Breznakibacter sp.]|nr:phospho-sugar mutase [Breznakibacter sp.]